MKLMEAIKATDMHGRMNVVETINEHGRMNLIHVQAVFPQEDVIALKKKTGESSIKEAVSKAVYHYLKCQKTDEDDD
jgi:hypothetical protein